jgi:hypothetical protein
MTSDPPDQRIHHEDTTTRRSATQNRQIFVVFFVILPQQAVACFDFVPALLTFFAFVTQPAKQAVTGGVRDEH